MPTYDKAPPADAIDRVARLIERYHAPLREAEARIDLVFARPTKNKNGDDVGNAVSHGGYRAAAKVRVVSLKDRSKGMGDAEIIVDASLYEEISDARRDALLDHELEHLEYLGKRDDKGRPKLRLIKHDHQFGWFDSIVRRHGKQSIEWAQYERLAVGPDSVVQQLWLPFVGDDAGSMLSRPAKLDGSQESFLTEVVQELKERGVEVVRVDQAMKQRRKAR